MEAVLFSLWKNCPMPCVMTTGIQLIESVVFHSMINYNGPGDAPDYVTLSSAVTIIASAVFFVWLNTTS